MKREARAVGALDGEQHVVDHGELGKQRGDLERAPQAQTSPAERREPCDVVVEERDAAGRRPDEAGDGVEERRLPRPVGAEDHEPLTLCRRQAHTAERLQAAEVVTEAFDGERRAHWMT